MSILKTEINDKISGRGALCLFTPIRQWAPGRFFLTFALVVLIAGCGITKNYQNAAVDIAPGWRVEDKAAADAANTTWWETFHDPVLTRLIETALKENKDLLIATARVDEAEARTKTAQSAFWPPDRVWRRCRLSPGNREPRHTLWSTLDRDFPVYQGLLSASWELDVWGRIRRSTEAARADYLVDRRSPPSRHSDTRRIGRQRIPRAARPG